MATATRRPRQLICKLAVLVCLFHAGRVTGYDNWDAYWEAWERDSHHPRMYPFGTEFHDDGFTSTYMDAEIQFVVPYYGRHYDTLAISINGHIELSHHGRQPILTPKDTLVKWPNPLYPVEADPAFISPYLSSIYSLGDDQVFYRRLDPREPDTTGRMFVDIGMLHLLEDHVRAHVLGADRFEAVYGVVVTWFHLSFFGCAVIPEANCPRNTFQAAVVTDEVDTYVIYNYNNITWAGSVRQQCDSDTGTASSIKPDCFEAQAGFNAGRAEDFRALPYSNSEGVVNLDDMDTVGVLGRFMYRVGPPIPLRGGCANNPDAWDPWPLEVSPSYGSMLGGERIYVSGPCFEESMPIKCQFGSIEVDGYRVNGTKSKAYCVSPRNWRIGKITLSVSTDGGVTYPYSTKFLVVPPRQEPRVMLENSDGAWFVKDPKQMLYFTWDPEALADFHDPADDGASHMVHISIWGYEEVADDEGALQIHMSELHVLEESYINRGDHSFRPEEERCTADCGWEKPPVGLLRICREDTLPEPEPYCVWSDPMPLGWYVHESMSEQYGDDWAHDVCIEWHDQEEEAMGWEEDLIPCPLTMLHAANDYGQYLHDANCGRLDQPVAKCPGYPGGDSYCVDDILPPPSHLPSSSRCCYNSDGDLIFGADTRYAGGSSRASPFGSLPYTEPATVPSLSHWYHDVAPYYMCCNWTELATDCVELYMSVRPTPDLLDYHPPKHAIAFGDPHFHTYDGVAYTFNGRGEYWLLRTVAEEGEEGDGLAQYDHVSVQARMQSPNIDMCEWGADAINATVMTAVAMQEGTTPDMTVPRVEVQLSEDIDLPVHLMVYVDGQLQDFTQPDFMQQVFTNMDGSRQLRIINNDPAHLNEQSNVTVMFQSGLAVQVANRDGLMHVILSAPELYHGHTSGLLGSWNDDPEDDLTRPDGSTIDPDTEQDDLHELFGENQVVDRTDSRFNYRAALDWEYYRDADFKPNFAEPEYPIWPPPGCNVTNADVDATCGDNFVCRFDMKMTLTAEVGSTSMDTQEWMEFVADVTKPMPTCGYLAAPHSQREVSSYLEGGHVLFSGCVDGYRFEGHDEYHCQGDDPVQWTPTPDPYCKSQKEIDDEKSKLATAIAVPICLLAVIAAVGVAGFFVYKRRKEEQDSSSSGGGKSGGNIGGGGSETETDAPRDNPGYTGSMAPAHSKTSIDSFGSNVLTQDLQPMRPSRPTSSRSQPPPHYSNAGMLQDLESRQGAPAAGPASHRNSTSSSNVSLTGIGAGVSLDPQGMTRYSAPPPAAQAPLHHRSFDQPSASLDQSVERPSMHGSQASLSYPASASVPTMHPSGPPPPPPQSAPPARSSVPPSPAVSSGRVPMNPGPQQYQGSQQQQQQQPGQRSDDDDAEYRMSVASRGGTLGSQRSLGSQNLVFTSSVVDTMV